VTSVDSDELVFAKSRDVLLLPRPARSITSISIGGAVSNATYSGGTALDATTYTSVGFTDTEGRILALRLLNGAVWGEGVAVNITGQFSSIDDDVDVPADFIYAVDYLIAEQFKIEQASPAGYTGPDGAVVPIRNPFKSDVWLKIKDKYALLAKALVI
jgi:hypothetical protein